jgi:hypothetical protein
MDIKKIVRKALLEQPDGEVAPNAPNPQPQLTRQQRETYDRFASKWKEQVPELTDEQMMKIYLEFRKALQLVKDESQPEVSGFLIRGNGKYTINDLRNPNKVNVKDLLDFLLELTRFRIKIDGGGDNGDEAKKLEKQRLDNVFSERTERGGPKSITPNKIVESKKMWEGQQNLIINEGNFRLYSVNTEQEAQRYGYYYQEKLRELLIHNIQNNVGEFKDMYRDPRDVSAFLRHSSTPWCVFSRGDDQKVMYNGRLLVNPIDGQYAYYRNTHSLFFYVAIDESKDLFGPGGEYYISTIMAKSGGGFKIANMYNGEYNISEEELLKIYPQLSGHFEKITFQKYNPKVEIGVDVEPSVRDIVNESEGSPNAFWMQTPDTKKAYIDAGGSLKNPKSWTVMNNDLRKQYIDTISDHDATMKVSTEEFLKAIIKSGVFYKERLDKQLRQVGFRGIGYLVDDFMKVNYRTDFYGKKNDLIKIYKNLRTNKHGIYDVDTNDWVNRDGIEYDAIFTKRTLPLPEGELEDFTNNKIYDVVEFASPNAKFYTLNDIDDKNDVVYILSERKYRELREKLENEEGVDDGNDVDIAEEQY